MNYRFLLIIGLLAIPLYYYYSQEIPPQSLLYNADNGDAQAKLGGMYLLGQGVPQDYDKARILLQQAADNNNSVGLMGLGNIYVLGLGVPQDIERGKLYLKKSCNNGYTDSCILLKKTINYQNLQNNQK